MNQAEEDSRTLNNNPLQDHLRRNTDWFDVWITPQAPTLLLVHGSTVTRRSWQPQIDFLKEHYQIITPDLPGHGALGAFPFTMESAIQVITSAAEASQNARFIIIGASLGGHVATLYASRHPDPIAGLVISGASMNFHGLVGGWTRLVGRLMPRLFSPARLQRTAEQSMLKKWPAETVTALVQAGIYPAGAFQSFLELPDYDFKALLKMVQSPVLILNGENDRPNRKEEQEFLAAAPQAVLEIIDGAGHACAIEKPQVFNQALLKFTQKVFG